MKAVVYDRYGPPEVLNLTEVEKPTPGHGEVLVRVESASVGAGDWHLMRGTPFLVRLMFGLRKPKNPTLGSSVAGRVEAVGPSVEGLRPGDEVWGELSDYGFGGFAEYVCVPEAALGGKPGGLTFEEAAAVPGSALPALQGLRDKGRIQPGQRVLINGASGGVGTFAVQLAKSFGAEVTGVCSTGNVELVRSLGADHVVDYTKEDFSRSGKRYDLILDAAAFRPLRDHLRALAPKGIYVLVGGAMAQTFKVMLLGPLIFRATKKKASFFISAPNQEDLAFLKGLAESKEVAPVIDRRYSLEQVPEAIGYVEMGHARGKVVIAL
jgi:NADPH:quinone reductase-like Zn-dependent oxidoreductase